MKSPVFDDNKLVKYSWLQQFDKKEKGNNNDSRSAQTKNVNFLMAVPLRGGEGVKG